MQMILASTSRAFFLSALRRPFEVGGRQWLAALEHLIADRLPFQSSRATFFGKTIPPVFFAAGLGLGIDRAFFFQGPPEKKTRLRIAPGQ
jgi:hypothetical protein